MKTTMQKNKVLKIITMSLLSGVVLTCEKVQAADAQAPATAPAKEIYQDGQNPLWMKDFTYFQNEDPDADAGLKNKLNRLFPAELDLIHTVNENGVLKHILFKAHLVDLTYNPAKQEGGPKTLSAIRVDDQGNYYLQSRDKFYRVDPSTISEEGKAFAQSVRSGTEASKLWPPIANGQTLRNGKTFSSVTGPSLMTYLQANPDARFNANDVATGHQEYVMKNLDPAFQTQMAAGKAAVEHEVSDAEKQVEAQKKEIEKLKGEAVEREIKKRQTEALEHGKVLSREQVWAEMKKDEAVAKDLTFIGKTMASEIEDSLKDPKAGNVHIEIIVKSDLGEKRISSDKIGGGKVKLDGQEVNTPKSEEEADNLYLPATLPADPATQPAQ